VPINMVAKECMQCCWVPRGTCTILKAGKAATVTREKLLAGQPVFRSLCANDHLVGARLVDAHRCSKQYHLLRGDEVSILATVTLTVNQSLVCMNSCSQLRGLGIDGRIMRSVSKIDLQL
jgi:hypothetical protein